jgi:aminopeptidase YwaD
VAPEGGKEPLRAEDSAYTMGSDHDVYQDSSFGIPAIYLNDWPDRYIHTNFDTAANIDPTKLKRAAFIGAASGYFLANRSNEDALAAWRLARRGGVQRQENLVWRNKDLPGNELVSANLPLCLYETKLLEPLRLMINALPLESREGFSADMPKCWTGYALKGAIDPKVAEAFRTVLRRADQPKGPLMVFGYDYFKDHAKAAGVATPKLLSYEGLWGAGEEYAYEVLNFADGKRNSQEIRDAVSAEYGPVPLELVVEYLKALEKIGLVSEVK